jgi:regulator of sigma E protease
MRDFVLAVIAFLVLLGPLILVHELGHFIAARMIGVTVLEFGIGFPPRAAKLFERGGTEFTLNWLPIGGFVRPLGEDFVKPLGDNATEADRAAYEARQAERTQLEKRNIKTKSLLEAGPWQRIWFMIAGVVFNIIFGFLIFGVIALTGLPRPQVELLTVATGSPAAQAGLKPGDAIFKLNGVEIETLQDIDDEIGNRIPKPINLEIWRAGAVQNVTVTPSETGVAGGDGGVYVTELVAGAPAESAGIKLGDRIVKVDDTFIKTNEELLAYNQVHVGKLVTVTLERDGQQIAVQLTPRANPPAGQGPIGAAITTAAADPAYGFALQQRADGARTKAMSIPDAIKYGWARVSDTLSTIINLPVRLVRGQVSAAEARPASIVAISRLGANIIQQSFQQQVLYPVLNFAGLLSIFIGVTQLLPIPGLDGGRIIFVVFELLRGKPINQEREGMIHFVGLMLLLGLTVIVVVNDIVNPIALPR